MRLANPPGMKTSKADLIAALKTAFAYCDKAYDGMTDASGGQIVKLFGTDTPKLGVLNFNNVHNMEHYGNLVTYMRIKGIVPPTSEQGKCLHQSRRNPNYSQRSKASVWGRALCPSASHPRLDADSRVDADCGSQGGHVLRHIPEHPLPRVLPSSRFQKVRLCGLVAHAGFLRKGRRALSLLGGDTAEETVLGSCRGRALAD
jgi:hypothetical protein